MVQKIVPVYHQQIARGPLAGCYVLVPFRPSTFAVDRAIEEQNALLAAVLPSCQSPSRLTIESVWLPE